VTSDGNLEAPATSWPAFCEDFAARFVEVDATDPRVATLRSMGDLEPAQWDALATMVRDHGPAGPPVLCHYDNRLPNLPMDARGVWLLDWDLAKAAPPAHELIKVFERPPAEATVDARALLRGYGLPSERHDDVVADALVALAMDAIEMSLGWIDQPPFHPAIRRWLTSIERIIDQLT
jgi:aminoglycoside phosphotransferase (APT) family kinase protein